jgi:hypothetical protein
MAFLCYNVLVTVQQGTYRDQLLLLLRKSAKIKERLLKMTLSKPQGELDRQNISLIVPLFTFAGH